MKKISRPQLRRLDRRAIRRYLKLQRRIWRNRKVRRVALIPDWGIWHAPEYFTLTGNHRGKLIRKLRSLRNLIATARGPVRLDFSKTLRLSSAGTLLFAAELRRMFKHFPHIRSSVRCTLGVNNKVTQVLKQIGILDLLGRKSRVIPCDDDVVSWHFTHGNKVDGVKFEEGLGNLSSMIEGNVQTELYEGFIEAMNNAIHHAYIGTRDDGLSLNDNNDWWMFSQCREGQITVVFCDLGLGIPVTLPKKKPLLWERILLQGHKLDADVIEYAVQDSVTRMPVSGRGYGLKQLIDVVTTTNTGSVAILSNRGRYFIDGKKTIKKNHYDDSICGTLIHWTIPAILQDGVSI